jgi:site-specific recombinase XerD
MTGTLTTAPLTELAADWLAAKDLSASTGTGHSGRARRGDLCRWGRALATSAGRPIAERPGGAFDIDGDLADLTPADLTVDNLLQALRSMRASYSPATIARSMATLRGWCRWLHRRGHLAEDPTLDDTLTVRSTGPADGEAPFHAFSTEEIERMRAATATPPPGARSAWPARDLALVEVLAGCGPRAAETCGLQVRHPELDLERPILRISRRAKGGKRRNVPIPHRTEVALRAYLAERAALAEVNPLLGLAPQAQLFLRSDGQPLSTTALDRVVRRLAATAGVAMPGDAAAHAFRHYFASQLAARGVPLALIQQLLGHESAATTAIYTKVAGRELVAALDDAGWL